MFFDAVKKGTLIKARLKTLLAKNIDIDGEDEAGYTASFYCIARNDLAMLELLVGNGANINWKNKDCLSLLHGACQFGHEKLVSFLIAKGADKDAQENDGCTALYLAIKANQTKCVEAMLAAGAKVNLAAKSRAVQPLFA